MDKFFLCFSQNVSVDNCVLENNSHILTLRRHSMKVESLLQYLVTCNGIDGKRIMTFHGKYNYFSDIYLCICLFLIYYIRIFLWSITNNPRLLYKDFLGLVGFSIYFAFWMCDRKNG